MSLSSSYYLLFSQIIEILLYCHHYQDTRAYILDPCIRDFLKESNIFSADMADITHHLI